MAGAWLEKKPLHTVCRQTGPHSCVYTQVYILLFFCKIGSMPSNDSIEIRPWGTFEVVRPNKGFDNFQVKELIVEPGKRLSLQSHNHRSEHWIVTSGSGLAVIGGDAILIGENSHVFVPTGVKHRLCNTSENRALRLIEVQVGPIISEEDIERFEDDHGRV